MSDDKHGQVRILAHSSTVLRGNALGDPADRDLYCYLPPGYDASQERYPVTLYTFSCGLICDTAQGLLNKRGVPHTVIDVTQGDGADRLKRVSGGLDAPALQVGDQYAVGFNEMKWQGMLSDAGYPKTPAPRSAPVGRPSAPAPAESSAATQIAEPTPATKGGYPQ